MGRTSSASNSFGGRGRCQMLDAEMVMLMIMVVVIEMVKVMVKVIV